MAKHFRFVCLLAATLLALQLHAALAKHDIHHRRHHYQNPTKKKNRGLRSQHDRGLGYKSRSGKGKGGKGKGGKGGKGGSRSSSRSSRSSGKGKGGKGGWGGTTRSGGSTTTTTTAEAAADDGGGLGGLCFSKHVKVHLQNKGMVSMKHLQVGDSILVDAASNKYEMVYAFGHYHPTRLATFYQLYTGGQENYHQQALEMTGAHLVYLHGKTNPVQVSSLKVGDVLQSSSNLNGKVITKIDMVQQKGIYAPLTPSGSFVVNDEMIQASSYIALHDDDVQKESFWKLSNTVSTPFQISHHDYVHMGLTPFRLLCNTGMSGLQQTVCQSYTREGLPYYVSFAIWLNQFAHQQHFLVEALILGIVVLVTGFLMLVETISTHADLMWWVMGTGMVGMAVWTVNDMMKRACIQVQAKKIKTV